MKKILTIGSVTADVIVKPVDNLPPSGTLVSVDGVSMHVGGCASNAAMDLAKLGANASLSCKVGKDTFGDFVKSELLQNGVDISGVVTDENVSTTVSIVCVASNGERSFLYNKGSSSDFRAEDINTKLADECDIAFIGGAMLLNSFDGEPAACFMEKMQKKGKYTVMDTAWDFEDIWLPKVKAVLPHLDLFMPSYAEAVKLAGEDNLDKIADIFIDMGAKNIIIKIGEKGAYIREAGKSGVIIPTYMGFKPIDTTGAGDAFCAGFLCGLSKDYSYEHCAKFANAVATHCILEVGASTGIPTIAKVEQFIKEN